MKQIQRTDNRQLELELSDMQQFAKHDQYDFITYADYYLTQNRDFVYLFLWLLFLHFQ